MSRRLTVNWFDELKRRAALPGTSVEQVTLSHEHVCSDWLGPEAALKRLARARG